jgi:urease accessory protein UreE
MKYDVVVIWASIVVCMVDVGFNLGNRQFNENRGDELCKW